MKREDSAKVGIESFHHEPGGDVSQEDLADLSRLGILVDCDDTNSTVHPLTA